MKNLLAQLPGPLRNAIKERVWPRPLAEGETIPEWHLQAHDGQWHRQGVHWTVMGFLPPHPAHEAVGQMLDDLQAHQARLAELGVRIFVVMPAESDVLQAIVSERALSFPLLTDRGSSVSRMFRAALQLPLRSFSVPTLYLVNPDRKIRLANRGTPSIAAVVRSVEALQQATRKGQ